MRRWMPLIVLLLFLAGCRAGVTTPTSAPQPGDTANASTAVPNNPSGGGQSVENMEQTSLEQAAAARGSAVYTGYACLISAFGCNCERPVIHAVRFDFANEGLYYRFAGQQQTGDWLLERVAANQWSYTSSLSSLDEETNEEEPVGLRFALLTFIEDGFILTHGADIFNAGEAGGDIIRCPDVTFRLRPEETP